MPIPDFQNLNSLQFIDPSMYQQGRAMVDQAQQAADIQNQQATQNVQATTLSNLYNEQNNPQLIAHQGLMNQGKQLDNTYQGMTNDVRSGALDQEKDAAKQKWLTNASEDDLKELNAHGEAYSVRGAAQNDPDMMAKGQRMIAASAKAMAAKAKAEVDQTKTETIVGGRLDAAGITADARNYAADQALAGRKYTADTQAKLKAIVKDPSRNLQQAYTKALADGDQEMADALFQTMSSLPMAGQAGKPSLPGYGVPVQGAPQSPTVPVRRPGVPAAGTGGAGQGENVAPPLSSESFNQNEGSPASVPKQAAMAASDITAIQQELANPKTPPETRRILQAQLDATQKSANALKAPAGRVIIYKDGKAAGSIPQAQVEAAKKQGYTLQ